MSASSLTFQLQQLRDSAGSAQQKSDSFSKVLAEIFNCKQDEQPELLNQYVQAIIADEIGVVNSRPLLSAFVEAFKTHANDTTKTEAGSHIITTLAPKAVSYEQQDTELKYIIADAYEEEGEFVQSARLLQTIQLDSLQRGVSDDEKARVWMRICRCFLEEGDSTNASAYLNKVKQIIHSVTDGVVRLQFQLSQAKIQDSQRAFLEASQAYYTVSGDENIHKDDRLMSLSAAIKCAILAPAGPLRARQLGILYKDDRAIYTQEHGILEKIFLNRLLAPAEVQAFAASLEDHQLAVTSDGSTVLDKAVLEHNLLAASRLYKNVAIDNLGTLLGVDADRAESYAAAMIESERLSGSIDQIEGIIYFNTKHGSKDAAAAKLRAWDENIQGLAEEVEKVTTLLQREEAQWYEAYVAA